MLLTVTDIRKLIREALWNVYRTKNGKRIGRYQAETDDEKSAIDDVARRLNVDPFTLEVEPGYDPDAGPYLPTNTQRQASSQPSTKAKYFVSISNNGTRNTIVGIDSSYNEALERLKKEIIKNWYDDPLDQTIIDDINRATCVEELAGYGTEKDIVATDGELDLELH